MDDVEESEGLGVGEKAVEALEAGELEAALERGKTADLDRVVSDLLRIQ